MWGVREVNEYHVPVQLHFRRQWATCGLRRVCAGTRLHFHELLKDRYWKARHLERRNYRAVVPSEEARALYEWLRAHPGVELELSDVVSQINSDAAAFVVRRAPSESAAMCGGIVD